VKKHPLNPNSYHYENSVESSSSYNDSEDDGYSDYDDDYEDMKVFDLKTMVFVNS